MPLKEIAASICKASVAFWYVGSSGASDLMLPCAAQRDNVEFATAPGPQHVRQLWAGQEPDPLTTREIPSH
jgi:hypothetical protein